MSLSSITTPPFSSPTVHPTSFTDDSVEGSTDPIPWNVLDKKSWSCKTCYPINWIIRRSTTYRKLTPTSLDSFHLTLSTDFNLRFYTTFPLFTNPEILKLFLVLKFFTNYGSTFCYKKLFNISILHYENSLESSLRLQLLFQLLSNFNSFTHSWVTLYYLG